MLRLYILRHVCANHTTPGQRDIDRAISERGKELLGKIRTNISQNDYTPQTIYCSPAVRTQQTYLGIKDAFAREPNIIKPEHLYAGVTGDYFSTILEHDTPESLMIIGHNPMCSDFAYSLCSTGTPEQLRKIVMGFGEGDFTVIDFEIDNWKDLKKNSGKVIDFKDHVD